MCGGRAGVSLLFLFSVEIACLHVIFIHPSVNKSSRWRVLAISHLPKKTQQTKQQRDSACIVVFDRTCTHYSLILCYLLCFYWTCLNRTDHNLILTSEQSMASESYEDYERVSAYMECKMRICWFLHKTDDCSRFNFNSLSIDNNFNDIGLPIPLITHTSFFGGCSSTS